MVKIPSGHLYPLYTAGEGGVGFGKKLHLQVNLLKKSGIFE